MCKTQNWTPVLGSFAPRCKGLLELPLFWGLFVRWLPHEPWGLNQLTLLLSHVISRCLYCGFFPFLFPLGNPSLPFA